MRVAPWSPPPIWRFGTIRIQMLMVFPWLPLPVRSPNCPRAGRQFLIKLQQPEHRAHSQRSPISTESHHEIGLQTGKCFIFSPQLTLIRRIPGPSGHIALFTPPCSFFIHGKHWHVCLEWLTAWNVLAVFFFSLQVVFKEFFQLSKPLRLLWNYPSVIGGMKLMCVLLWYELFKMSHPGSN